MSGVPSPIVCSFNTFHFLPIIDLANSEDRARVSGMGANVTFFFDRDLRAVVTTVDGGWTVGMVFCLRDCLTYMVNGEDSFELFDFCVLELLGLCGSVREGLLRFGERD